MFALSDYYISLFGFLVEQDAEGQGAWDWVIPLAGSGKWACRVCAACCRGPTMPVR